MPPTVRQRRIFRHISPYLGRRLPDELTLNIAKRVQPLRIDTRGSYEDHLDRNRRSERNLMRHYTERYFVEPELDDTLQVMDDPTLDALGYGFNNHESYNTRDRHFTLWATDAPDEWDVPFEQAPPGYQYDALTGGLSLATNPDVAFDLHEPSAPRMDREQLQRRRNRLYDNRYLTRNVMRDA